MVKIDGVHEYIPAMGADHITQDKMRKVIDIMRSQLRTGDMHKELSAVDYIRDRYGVDVCKHGICVMNYVDYVAEEKYDGYSYLNICGRFFSKRLSDSKDSKGEPIEKTQHLPHLSKVLKRAYEIGGCDFQGEVYIPGGISDDVTKIMGCAPDKAIDRIYSDYERRPRYMLIDIRMFNNKPVINEPYYIRRALLEYAYYEYIVAANFGSTDIHLAEILHGDPCAHFTRIVRSGGEGIIIKKTNAIFVPGKKPAGVWIKGKKKITIDVIITGYNDGTGKNADKFGSFKFGLMVDGEIKDCGNCSSGLNDATRDMIVRDPDKYIGHVMEIEAIQESVKSFRNAVFLRLRDDKSPAECTPDSVRVKDVLL